MQQLDALTLKHLANELNTALCGAKINKIAHPAQHEFILSFFGGNVARSQRLYINLNPMLPCCALLPANVLEQLVIATFEKPTGFCMLLRKHLMNARIEKVDPLTGERVINIWLENTNELGNRVKYLLTLELMGKHSNMMLVDDLQQTILGVAHTVSETMSRVREVGVNLPYVTPPRPADKPLLFVASPQAIEHCLDQVVLNDSAQVAEALLKHFWGLGKTQLTQLLMGADTVDRIIERLHQLATGHQLTPALSDDGKQFTLRIDPEGLWHPNDSVLSMVNTYCTRQWQAVRIEQLTSQCRQMIERQLERLAKRLEDQSPADPEELEHLRYLGDLILTAFSAGQLPTSPSETQLTLSDYQTGEPIVLAIDPNLNWTENANRYYRKAKKETQRHHHYEEAREQVEAQKAYYHQLLSLANQCDSLSDALALRDDLVAANLLKPLTKLTQKKEPTPREAGVLQFTATDGTTLLVGKSGRANALLVGKLSRPDDIWLHVHQSPGSHVLIKTEKQTVSDDTLLEAATLAVHYSPARHSLNVPVIYTAMRYVKKIPQSYPGHVRYSHEETLFISPQAECLNRLLMGLQGL